LVVVRVRGREVVVGLLELRAGVVDLGPGFGVREGEFVRGDADRRAILFVDGGDLFVEVAGGVMVGCGES
jgi:hypothetical protein